MNKCFLSAAILAMTLILFPTAQAQTEVTSSVGLINYSAHASAELRQLRAQIEATVHQTPLAGQAQLAPYVNALSAAEQALVDFKTAPQIELDRRQVELETAKQKAVSLWNDYNSSHANSVEGSRAIEAQSSSPASS